MIAYRIVTASSAADLQTLVNALAGEGWAPIGGVGVRSWVETDPDGAGYFRPVNKHYAELMQAMVRDTPRKVPGAPRDADDGKADRGTGTPRDGAVVRAAKVLATVPSSGEMDVAVDVLPRVTFDREVHPSEIDVRLECPPGDQIPWTRERSSEDPQTVQIRPFQSLAAGERCVLTLRSRSAGAASDALTVVEFVTTRST